MPFLFPISRYLHNILLTSFPSTENDPLSALPHSPKVPRYTTPTPSMSFARSYPHLPISSLHHHISHLTSSLLLVQKPNTFLKAKPPMPSSVTHASSPQSRNCPIRSSPEQALHAFPPIQTNDASMNPLPRARHSFQRLQNPRTDERGKRRNMPQNASTNANENAERREKTWGNTT
jgi:hypothetical protein